MLDKGNIIKKKEITILISQFTTILYGNNIWKKNHISLKNEYYSKFIFHAKDNKMEKKGTIKISSWYYPYIGWT